MKEDIEINCTNDVYKYTPDEIYDYIYKLESNWKELKKWAKKRIEPLNKDLKELEAERENFDWYSEEYKNIEKDKCAIVTEKQTIMEFLNKMQELENKDVNNK